MRFSWMARWYFAVTRSKRLVVESSSRLIVSWDAEIARPISGDFEIASLPEGWAVPDRGALLSESGAADFADTDAIKLPGSIPRKELGKDAARNFDLSASVPKFSSMP